MVFRNLPIEFDLYGRAHLRDEDAPSPFSTAQDGRRALAVNRERALARLVENQNAREFLLDPLTRTTGRLTLRGLVDFNHRRILDAQIETTEPRTHEAGLVGREASDAVPIMSRVNGTASGAHSIAAAMAVEMACGAIPPPLAVLARNLGSCAEVIAASIHHLFLYAGPDYAEAAVSRTSLVVWAKAQRTSAPNYAAHGLETIADVMRGINPFTGHLYAEALQMGRLAREVCVLMFGRHPHPSTVFPAGVAVEGGKETFNLALGRINTLLDYAKKVTAIWDDLVEFLYNAEPRYRRVGELPGNLLSVGLWDDPDFYDASYLNANNWGEHRLSPPGVVVNNELRTTRLTDLVIGTEVFDEHAYFAKNPEPQNGISAGPQIIGAVSGGNGVGLAVPADPLSAPLSPRHPWNRVWYTETAPQPAARDWRGKYSWSPAPRWDREPMESGALARLWVNALVGAKSERQHCEFIAATRRGLEIDLPRGQQPAVRLRWHLPERPNTLERNRARAYQIAAAGMAAYANILKAFECVRRGENSMSVRFRAPERKNGVGLWESGQGVVMHFLALRDRRIGNYQCLTPSDWMGSPRDEIGVPGTYESALINTPLLEECLRWEDFTGIDILRTIRSFDP